MANLDQIAMVSALDGVLAVDKPAGIASHQPSQRLLRLLQHSPNTIYISGHHHIYFPGHIGELRTIAAPALGAGARSLLGAPPVTGFVQITIPPQAPPKVTALVAPDFTRMIDIKTLPAHLVLADREDTGMAEYIMEMMDNSVNTNNL